MPVTFQETGTGKKSRGERRETREKQNRTKGKGTKLGKLGFC